MISVVLVRNWFCRMADFRKMCAPECYVYATICFAFLLVAPQMAYPTSHNPFAGDDDEEEEDFKPRSRGFDEDPDTGLSDAEKRQRHFQQEVKRTAQSAVDSSYRSLGLLYESEKMGVETAEVCCICSVLHQDTDNVFVSNADSIPASL